MSGARAKRAPPAGAWSNLRPRDSIRSPDRETRRTASRNLTEPSSPDPFSSLSVPPAVNGFAEHFRPTDEQSMAEPQRAAPKRRLVFCDAAEDQDGAPLPRRGAGGQGD